MSKNIFLYYQFLKHPKATIIVYWFFKKITVGRGPGFGNFAKKIKPQLHSPPHHRAAPRHCCRDDCPCGGCRCQRWPLRCHRCRPRPKPSGWLFHCHHSHCHRPPPAGPFPATAASSPSWPSWPVLICYLRDAKLRKKIEQHVRCRWNDQWEEEILKYFFCVFIMIFWANPEPGWSCVDTL